MIESLHANDGEPKLTRVVGTLRGLSSQSPQLPIIDGYDATRRMKGSAELKSIPIIAVTSYALSGDKAKARTAGCDGYASKPFSPRELLARVREYLPDAGAS
jgi:two-component system, cell cycle response regulator DivK